MTIELCFWGIIFLVVLYMFASLVLGRGRR